MIIKYCYTSNNILKIDTASNVKCCQGYGWTGDVFIANEKAKFYIHFGK